jgi:hypothetical protein
VSEIEALRQIKPGDMLTSANVFDAIFEAGSELSAGDREADQALEIAIRLLEARRNGQIPEGCEQAIEFLAEECGLYPYIDADNFGLLTQTVIEAHAINLKEKKLYLHSKQMQVLLWLLEGQNVVLSAPTSFGKSLLLDALIARKKPDTIVVILPTIALIDETRRRLSKTFGNRYHVITTVSESYRNSKPTIFVLTQERFLQRADDLAIDLLFVDEFYKLDPDRDDGGRFETLNLALYRALPKAKQCFMAGPHIRNIDLGDRWTGNFRFVRTEYRTVTVNVIDRTAKAKKLEAFLADLVGVGEESSLVFTATPRTAQDLMLDILRAKVSYHSDLGASLQLWIAKNYHEEWPIAWGSAHGIAVHHGRLPRSIGQLFVRLFDEGEIKVIICTSTIIEGVNTSAANVFIYDKKINTTDFDFFSFANIRGRVGRMMRHFVGNAYLYHEPPEEIETHVQVPVLSDPGSSTDYLVMNVARNELSSQGQHRQDRLPEVTGLPPNILREHGALGFDVLVELRNLIQWILTNRPGDLIWSGFPNRDQRIAIAELCLKVAHSRREQTGLHTPRRVGWAWSQLQRLSTLPKFLRWFSSTFSAKGISDGIDMAFQFLLACEFGFPRSLAAVESILIHEGAKIAYGPYIAGLQNWFRPPWMKELDEAGVPLPLAERLERHLSQPQDRSDAIAQIAELALDRISGLDQIDRFILRSALDGG